MMPKLQVKLLLLLYCGLCACRHTPAVDGAEVGPTVDLAEVLGEPCDVPARTRRDRRSEICALEHRSEPLGVGYQMIDIPVGGALGSRIGVHGTRR